MFGQPSIPPRFQAPESRNLQQVSPPPGHSWQMPVVQQPQLSAGQQLQQLEPLHHKQREELQLKNRQQMQHLLLQQAMEGQLAKAQQLTKQKQWLEERLGCEIEMHKLRVEAEYEQNRQEQLLWQMQNEPLLQRLQQQVDEKDLLEHELHHRELQEQGWPSQQHMPQVLQERAWHATDVPATAVSLHAASHTPASAMHSEHIHRPVDLACTSMEVEPGPCAAVIHGSVAQAELGAVKSYLRSEYH